MIQEEIHIYNPKSTPTQKYFTEIQLISSLLLLLCVCDTVKKRERMHQNSVYPDKNKCQRHICRKSTELCIEGQLPNEN